MDKRTITGWPLVYGVWRSALRSNVSRPPALQKHARYPVTVQPRSLYISDVKTIIKIKGVSANRIVICSATYPSSTKKSYLAKNFPSKCWERTKVVCLWKRNELRETCSLHRGGLSPGARILQFFILLFLAPSRASNMKLDFPGYHGCRNCSGPSRL